MNVDHTRMIAEMHATVCGHIASMARARRRARAACVACLIACSALVAIAPVQAQDRGLRKDDQQQHRDDRDERAERNAQRQDAPHYELRPEDARRQQDHGGDAQRPRSGRLTADERRDLRRQINEAGVDLYPNTPRR